MPFRTVFCDWLLIGLYIHRTRVLGCHLGALPGELSTQLRRPLREAATHSGPTIYHYMAGTSRQRLIRLASRSGRWAPPGAGPDEHGAARQPRPGRQGAPPMRDSPLQGQLRPSGSPAGTGKAARERPCRTLRRSLRSSIPESDKHSDMLRNVAGGLRFADMYRQRCRLHATSHLSVVHLQRVLRAYPGRYAMDRQ